MKFEIDNLTSDKELLKNSLVEYGAVFVSGTAFKCPAHEDGHASGGIFKDIKNHWRYKCQVCDFKGDLLDLYKLQGKPLTEPRKPIVAAPAKPETTAKGFTKDEIKKYLETQGDIEQIYKYHSGTGEILFYVARIKTADGKTIRPFMPKGGGYVFGLPPAPRPLYNLLKIKDAESVILVEGEKKADILCDLGFPSTTSPGGSKAAKSCDFTPLKGKRVTIWPDADLPGLSYAADCEKILRGLDAQVSIIKPDSLDLKDGEDAADYIGQLKIAGHDDNAIKKAVLDVIGKAKPTGAAADLDNHFQDIFSGRCRPIKIGFTSVDRAIQILPDSVTLVAGNPGASKSFLMLQLAANWIESNIKTAIFEIEKDLPFHLKRILAQRTGNSSITSMAWAEQNQEIIWQAQSEHREFLDNIGRHIWTCPDKIITQANVVEWTRERAASGYQAIIIDPITIADRKDEPHRADALLMQELRGIAREHRTAIFLVIHPSKAVITMPDLMQISGGAAYSRFCDNAIWLENHEAKTSTTTSACGTSEIEHNRTLWILKSRDGSGTGAKLACNFEGESLLLKEAGLIIKKRKNKNEY
jgi:hypothetical protein